MGHQNETKIVYISFLQDDKFKALIKWNIKKEELSIKDRKWNTTFTWYPDVTRHKGSIATIEEFFKTSMHTEKPEKFLECHEEQMKTWKDWWKSAINKTINTQIVMWVYTGTRERLHNHIPTARQFY